MNVYEFIPKNKSKYKSHFIGRLAATLLSSNQNKMDKLREV